MATTIPIMQAPAEKKDIRTRGTGSVAKLSIKQKDGSHIESRYWYIWYYGHNGKQIRESSKSESKMVAERLLRERLESIGKGVQNPQNAGKMKYEEMRAALVQDYAANGSRLAGIEHCDAFFQGRKASTITVDTLKAFRDKRLAEGAAPGTVNRNLSFVRRMFNLMRQEGKLSAVPYFPMMSEEGNARTGFVEPADLAKIMNHIPEKMQPLITFLYFTGCRIGAALKITWRQIEVNKESVFVRLEGTQTKSGEPLLLPLPKELADTLRKQFRRVDAPVFDCTKSEIARLWKRAVETVFMDGLLLHDLRRSGVRNLIDAGVPEDTAMKISGHKTRSIFTRYNIVDNRRLADAMAKVEASNAQKAAQAAS